MQIKEQQRQSNWMAAKKLQDQKLRIEADLEVARKKLQTAQAVVCGKSMIPLPSDGISHSLGIYCRR